MLVLDAGALIAAERGSKYVAALVKRERERGRTPITNGSVVVTAGSAQLAKTLTLSPTPSPVVPSLAVNDQDGTLLEVRTQESQVVVMTPVTWPGVDVKL